MFPNDEAEQDVTPTSRDIKKDAQAPDDVLREPLDSLSIEMSRISAEIQSINSGFEGTITALGAIPGENPPTLIAAVVRFTTFLKGAAETQIIMTTGDSSP